MDIVKKLRERSQRWSSAGWGNSDVFDAAADEIERLREALKGLLQCPAIADGNHNEPAWYDPETAMAEKKARAALKEGE